jgi:hypothetical protein
MSDTFGPPHPWWRSMWWHAYLPDEPDAAHRGYAKPVGVGLSGVSVWSSGASGTLTQRVALSGVSAWTSAASGTLTLA